MIAGLQTEIDRHPDLTGAGKNIIMEKLNNPESGETGEWIVSENECLVPKGDMLALLSAESRVKLIKWMRAEASDEALDFHEFYNTHEHFKTSDPVFRGIVSSLAPSLITESERDTVLRLGERKKSRAEELFNRKITAEDF